MKHVVYLNIISVIKPPHMIRKHITKQTTKLAVF